MTTQPILRVRDLKRSFATGGASGAKRNTVRAVDGVDLDINEGETLAIVGESGSGKSTLAKLLLMLSEPTAGDIQFRGLSLTDMSVERRRSFRREVQAVFQDPASSLNPRMTVERLLSFIVQRHALTGAGEVRPFLLAQLASVGLEPPELYLSRYPHQLSGGQQQRVAIARAMMLRPRVIIADEPLSSLDISIQAQILQLMRDLSNATNVGFVLISHDLNAMQSIAQRTAVMYRGRIVEIGKTVYTRPLHPYTKLLLDARLSLDPRRSRIRELAASPVRTVVNEPLIDGCRFRHRCPHAIEICTTSDPPLRHVGHSGTQAACHRVDEIDALAPAASEAAQR